MKRGFLLGSRALPPSPHPAVRRDSSSSGAAGRRSAQRPLAQQRLVLARKLFLTAFQMQARNSSAHAEPETPKQKPLNILIHLAQARTQGSKGEHGVEKWSEPHDLELVVAFVSSFFERLSRLEEMHSV